MRAFTAHMYLTTGWAVSAVAGREEEYRPNPGRPGGGKPRDLSIGGVGRGGHEGVVSLVRAGQITKGL